MNEETLLHRQVNRHWIKDGVITSQTFMPSRKDNGFLSTYNGEMMSARESWEHFTGALGFNSVGVVSVSVGECSDQGLQAIPDPLPSSPAHTVIDFRNLSRRMRERKADSLKMAAIARGWQYLPDA